MDKRNLFKYVIIIISLAGGVHLAFAAEIKNSCLDCHQGLDDKRLSEPVVLMRQDEAHAKAGISCVDCHGGDAASDDIAVAMDEARGFTGKPAKGTIPKFCGKCHVAQYELVSKSPHKSGFEKLGIPGCKACHGDHDIKKPSDELLGAGEDALCVKCHVPASAALKEAALMRDSIEDLKADIAKIKALAVQIARLGMEIEDVSFELNEADSSLARARTSVHTFSVQEVASVVQTAEVSVKKAGESAQKSIDKFSARKKWYLTVMFLILIFSLSLYARIRMMENKT